jgi:hypothetical protein
MPGDIPGYFPFKTRNNEKRLKFLLYFFRFFSGVSFGNLSDNRQDCRHDKDGSHKRETDRDQRRYPEIADNGEAGKA